MQSPVVPVEVEGETGAGMPLWSSGRDGREHSADAAQRTRVPHCLVNEYVRRMKKERRRSKKEA